MGGRQSLAMEAGANQKARPKGRLRQSDRFQVETYNMAAPSKMQLQLLDTPKCIFLPEVWDKAYKYMDYGGPKRFLVTEVAGRHDMPGAVAWRLSAYAARMMTNWGTCAGAESRTCWLKFEIAGGRQLLVVGVYVPPDYRTNPTQTEGWRLDRGLRARSMGTARHQLVFLMGRVVAPCKLGLKLRPGLTPQTRVRG